MKKVLLTGVAGLLVSLLLATTAVAESPIPRAVGNFDIVQPDGTRTPLASYKGKVVVVQFLSTICEHCQAYSGQLAAFQAELGSKGFQALGVAFVEASPAQTSAYATRFAQNAFPVGYAELEPVLKYLGLSVMQRIGVPQIIVIDKKGMIRAQSEPSGAGQLSDPAYVKTLVGQLLAEK